MRIHRRTGPALPLLLLAPLTFVACDGEGEGGGGATACAAGGGALAAPAPCVAPDPVPELAFQGLAGGLTDPGFLALDGTYAYWADSTEEVVYRAPKEAGDAFAIAGTGGPPSGLVLDATHVYWGVHGEGRGTGRIRRAPKGGGDTQDVATGQAVPKPLYADGAWVYWVEAAAGDESLRRAPVGGGAVTAVPLDGQVTEQWAGPGRMLALHLPASGGSAVSQLAPCGDGVSAVFTDPAEEIDEIAVSGDDLVFVGGDNVARVPLGGGSRALVAAVGRSIRGLAANDGLAWFVAGGALMQVPVAGGAPVELEADPRVRGDLVADGPWVYWLADMDDGPVLVRRLVSCDGAAGGGGGEGEGEGGEGEGEGGGPTGPVEDGYSHTVRGNGFDASNGKTARAAVAAYDRTSVIVAGESVVADGSWAVDFKHNLPTNTTLYVVWTIDADGDGRCAVPDEPVYAYELATRGSGQGGSKAWRPDRLPDRYDAACDLLNGQ